MTVIFNPVPKTPPSPDAITLSTQISEHPKRLFQQAVRFALLEHPDGGELLKELLNQVPSIAQSAGKGVADLMKEFSQQFGYHADDLRFIVARFWSLAFKPKCEALDHLVAVAEFIDKLNAHNTAELAVLACYTDDDKAAAQAKADEIVFDHAIARQAIEALIAACKFVKIPKDELKILLP